MIFLIDDNEFDLIEDILSRESSSIHNKNLQNVVKDTEIDCRYGIWLNPPVH